MITLSFESVSENKSMRGSIHPSNLARSKKLHKLIANNKDLVNIRVRLNAPVEALSYIMTYLQHTEVPTKKYPLHPVTDFISVAQPWEITWLATVKKSLLTNVLAVATVMEMKELCLLIYVFLHDSVHNDSMPTNFITEPTENLLATLKTVFFPNIIF